jgi:hypothetical protein
VLRVLERRYVTRTPRIRTRGAATKAMSVSMRLVCQVRRPIIVQGSDAGRLLDARTIILQYGYRTTSSQRRDLRHSRLV